MNVGLLFCLVAFWVIGSNILLVSRMGKSSLSKDSVKNKQVFLK